MQELQQSDFEDLGTVSLVLEGNKEAFGKIIIKYEKLLFKLANNFLGRRAEIEDTVQEIFLEIFKSLGSFQLGRRFTPWLYAIALNVLRKKYKHRLRRMQLQEDLLQLEQQTSPDAEGPEELVAAEETRRLVREAVRGLPENLREVTVLYYMEELSVKEICDILALSCENVKSRLFRARKKLKKMLFNVQLD